MFNAELKTRELVPEIVNDDPALRLSPEPTLKVVLLISIGPDALRFVALKLPPVSARLEPVFNVTVFAVREPPTRLAAPPIVSVAAFNVPPATLRVEPVFVLTGPVRVAPELTVMEPAV